VSDAGKSLKRSACELGGVEVGAQPDDDKRARMPGNAGGADLRGTRWTKKFALHVCALQTIFGCGIVDAVSVCIADTEAALRPGRAAQPDRAVVFDSSFER
jgi:hypothetical protein